MRKESGLWINEPEGDAKETISLSYIKGDLSALVACPTQTVCLVFGWLGTGHPTAHCCPLDYGLKLRLRVAGINNNISSVAFTMLFMPTLGRIFSFDFLHQTMCLPLHNQKRKRR